MSVSLLEFSDQDCLIGEQTILQKVSLRFTEGEKIALIGPSGAGKSTLLMALHKQLRNTTALCPQQLGLVDTLSVYHNIYMGQLENHSSLYNLWNLLKPLASHHKAISEMAQPLGLDKLLHKPITQLSGGERQRVALARALYRKQTIFMGDEPVSSLDVNQGQQLLIHILKQHRSAVVALHNPELALSAFNRIVGLRAGKIVFDQPASTLNSEQVHRFYLGE